MINDTGGSGSHSSVLPSAKSYDVAPRHAGQANLVFLDGHVGAFRAAYLGCGVGDPGHGDVQWDTGSGGVNWRPGG